MTPPYLSELRIFSFGIVPKGWLPCDGRILSVSQYSALFALLGAAYGGNGLSTFAIPDLRARVPIHQGPGWFRGEGAGEEFHTLTTAEIPNHTHTAQASTNPPEVNTPLNNFWSGNNTFGPYGDSPDNKMSAAALANTGANTPHNNMAPYLVTNICIAIEGFFPSQVQNPEDDSFMAEIRMFAGAHVPETWMTCDGQEIKITSNTGLFSMLGTNYGSSTGLSFDLPRLTERAALKSGKGAGLEEYDLGTTGGVVTVTLTENEIPVHTHSPMATAQGTQGEPTNNIWANPAGARPFPNFFAASIGNTAVMNSGCIRPVGGSTPHNNLMPFTVFIFCISTQGVIPSRPLSTS